MPEPPMTEPGEPVPGEASSPQQAEDLLGLNPELVCRIDEALSQAREAEAAPLIEGLHYAELADLLELMHAEAPSCAG